MVLPPGADDQECESEQTWWSHMLSFGHKEALRALDLPWNGFLDWTTRLWSTATMAAASLLGAGFFLTITVAVMLFVHKWLPRHVLNILLSLILDIPYHLFSMITKCSITFRPILISLKLKMIRCIHVSLSYHYLPP